MTEFTNIKLKPKNILTLLLLSLIITSCFTTARLPKTKNTITIAAITNTRPVSPFKDMPPNRTNLIRTINEENPDIVIHTGNIIHGGHTWMGIDEKDIATQFDSSLKLFSQLSTAFYPVAGTYDSFNNSFDIYTKKMKRALNYSFNFGSTHFIVLNTVTIEETHIDIDREWLKKDLELHKNYPDIILLTHNPIINPRQRKIHNKLHTILRNYNVKLVISGNSYNFYNITRNNIRYINIHSECFEDNYKCKNAKQLYILKYKNGIVTVIGKTIPISK